MLCEELWVNQLFLQLATIVQWWLMADNSGQWPIVVGKVWMSLMVIGDWWLGAGGN